MIFIFGGFHGKKCLIFDGAEIFYTKLNQHMITSIITLDGFSIIIIQFFDIFQQKS